MAGLTQSDIDKWLRDNPDLEVDGEKLPEKVGEIKSWRDILETVASGNEERIKTHMRTLMRQDEPEIPFKSKTERRAWEQWIPTTNCVEAYYEPIRVTLNSGTYKPDFGLRMPTRELWLVEVKGSWDAYASGRSSKKSLKEAATMYWWLARWFSLLPKKGGDWNFEEIT